MFPKALFIWGGVIFVALLLEAGFTGLVPLGIRFFIDDIVISRDLQALYLLMGVMAGGTILAVSAGLVRDYLAAKIQSRSLSGLRQGMFEKAQGMSLSFHTEGQVHNAQSRTADVLERFSNDVASIENAATLAIPWGVLPLTEAIMGTALMLWLDWRAGAAACLLWPWILLAPQTAARRVTRAAEARTTDENGVLGTVRENLTAQAMIRAFSLEQMGMRGFRRRNDLLSRSMMRAGLVSAFMDRVRGAGILSIRILVLILSAWLAFSRQITAGTLVALQMLAVTLGNALLYVVEYVPALSHARKAWCSIDELIHAPASVPERPGARFLPPLQTEIVFSHVDFSYDGDRPAVSDVRARIPRGSYVAFVGSSGSGKSTLLHLLMRLHDPVAGFIAIDGHDLRSVTQASLRQQIGAVLQETSVFQIPIRENIRVGRPEASEEAIVGAAKAVGLHDAIMGLPEDYATVLGEHSARLNPAEMQRLAIARAILRDPAILLLDEATSSLDPADEIAVNRTLRQLAGQRTVIAATHRLSTVADADHIFVIEQGRIAEQGSHYELLAADGVYANLWRKQAGFTFSADGRHVDVDARRLMAFPILGRLDEEKLAELAPYFATETFSPGREIVRQNDPGDKFYIIARGKVEVWRTEEQSGNTASLAVLQDGDFFGEITLITGFPRTATVRAKTLCTCISLGRGQFNRMMDRFPDLRKHLSEIALQRLRESSKAIAASVFIGL